MTVAGGHVHVGPETDHPHHGNGQGQPPSFCPPWIDHLRLLPLPTTTRGTLKALFTPPAQPIPFTSTAIRR